MNTRAPGVALHKMPLLVWSVQFQSIIYVLAMSVLADANTMILTDRKFTTSFSTQQEEVTQYYTRTYSGSSDTLKYA
jgi:heme/copper-type cytochrome/quinol oxidase subunit 1